MNIKDNISIGIIGLGSRAKSLVNKVFIPILKEEDSDLKISAICDKYYDRTEEISKLLTDETGVTPFTTTDADEVINMPDLDAIIILAGWESHVSLAVKAMHAGKYVGLEVGGAYSIEDCWQLVRAYEETGIPCMMLENCCYGQREMMLYNMLDKGILGKVVSCEGGYCHDLRDEISFGVENRHYRLKNYMYRNCENYPTHELGPISKLLKINNGNRMLSLTSMSSASRGLHEYILKNKSEDNLLINTDFAQGDVVTTVIRCAEGQTITLSLSTTLPRSYSRKFSVFATKGCYIEENDSVFLDSEENKKLEFDWKEKWGNAEEYAREYDHPLWKSFSSDVRGDHGGMDWLVMRAFIESVKAQTDTPIDVYDVAAWMSISVLSEQSIIMGGAPVAIPDFTRGKWINRSYKTENRFSLNKICDEQKTRLY